MVLPFAKLEEYKDVSKWVSDNKLTFEDVCKTIFNIDIINDERNAFIYYVVTNDTVKITDNQLVLCGYSGQKKKKSFLRLLKKNAHITWSDTKTDGIEMNNDYFGLLLMQMNTKETIECRQLYWFFKQIENRYLKYEKLNVERDDENTKAALIRNRRSISTDVIEPLREEVAPLVAPKSITPDKERWLALFNLDPKLGDGKKWYVMRCQKGRFTQSVKELKDKNPSVTEVKIWTNVSHSIDCFNMIKSNFVEPIWLVKGNHLEQKIRDKEKGWYTDEALVEAMETIMSKNPAKNIADTVEKIIE